MLAFFGLPGHIELIVLAICLSFAIATTIAVVLLLVNKKKR